MREATYLDGKRAVKRPGDALSAEERERRESERRGL